MHGAWALQRLGDVSKLALAVLADCLGRLDVTESHGYLRDRPCLERLAAAQFAFYPPAAFSRLLFHRHLATSFSPPLFRHGSLSSLFPVATKRSAHLLAARRRQDAECLAVL